MAISWRPAQPEDEPLLLEVYASTRADELNLVPWTAEEKQAFIQMQFTAQRQSYAQQFPQAQWQVIMSEGVPIGRLIVDRAADEILIMDIALLPQYRNHGIGTALMCDLLAEARQTRRRVRLHVEFYNPAQHLYERLGFIKIGEVGVYFELVWQPATEPVN
jgi:ribosomal protein S18 acetylase RimI-like enzyme